MSAESSNSHDPQEQSKEEIERKALQKALHLLSDPGFLSAFDDEKEDTSPPETNVHPSTSDFMLKLRLKTPPPPESATPSKRPFDDIGNDEDGSQGKEKKKKEEPHGGNTKYKKPKEAEPLEPFLISTKISLLRHILGYHSQKDSWSLKDFMTNWLGVDVLESDLVMEIQKLREKYEKQAEEILRNLNAMEPLECQAFLLAHEMWSAECETEILLDVEQRMTEEEISRKYQKESISIQEAETIFLEMFAKYFQAKGVHPFDHVEGRNDFIRNWVQDNDPEDKFEQIIQALKIKYQKKVIKMLKNVGILGPRDRVEFGLAKQQWNN